MISVDDVTPSVSFADISLKKGGFKISLSEGDIAKGQGEWGLHRLYVGGSLRH